MFFLRRAEPLDLQPDRIHGLRTSLNSPVVTAEGLPVGPARAAILVHDEPDGRPNVTIGVRSQKAGEVVLYSYDGDLREESSIAVGLDGALSFGETMGFLFDDDEMAGPAPDGPARERAAGLWRDMIGEAPLPAQDEADEPVLELVEEVGNEGIEALPDLPDTAPAGLSAMGESPMASGPSQTAAPALIDAAWPDEPGEGDDTDATLVVGAAPLLLSKFRREEGDTTPAAAKPVGDASESAPVMEPASPAADGSFQEAAVEPQAIEPAPLPDAAEALEPAPAPAPARRKKRRGLGRAALGRVRLVKRRLGGGPAPEATRSWIQRVLTSF